MPGRRMTVDRELHVQPGWGGSGGPSNSKDEARIAGICALVVIGVIISCIVWGPAQALMVFGGIATVFTVFIIFAMCFCD